MLSGDRAPTTIPITDTTDNHNVPAKPKKYKTTPLPLRQMVPMTIVLLNESLCGAMLLPFVGLLVASLQDVHPDEAGYFAGMLVGVFMLGQVISARMWGWISDQYGRRFPIISGLFTSGVMMLMFGLSGSVWQCALFRFLHGLFTGNVLVAKTMMADITDCTNQAKGFAFISFCSGIGFLIGPALGGIIYDPTNPESALSWLHLDPEGIFGRRPALLPSLFVFVYTNIGMLVCTFFVQESNPNAKPLPRCLRCIYPCFWISVKPFVHSPLVEDDEESDSDAMMQVVCISDDSPKDDVIHTLSDSDVKKEDMLPADPPVIIATVAPATSPRNGEPSINAQPVDPIIVPTVREEAVPLGNPNEGAAECMASDVLGDAADLHQDKEEAPAPDDVDVNVNKNNSNNREEEDDEEEVNIICVDTDNAEAEAFGYREAFSRPITRFMLVTYMILCASDATVKQCFPLWAISSTEAGGMGLSSKQVGYILLFNSFPTFMANYFFSLACERYRNKIGLFRLGLVAAGCTSACITMTAYLKIQWLQYVAVVLCTAGQQFFMSWCYGLINMLTARAAPPGQVGTIMGINQSCGASARGMVPFVAAPLFAWSISGNHVFPFNHVLVFFLSSTSFLYCWYRSYGIRTTPEMELEMVL